MQSSNEFVIVTQITYTKRYVTLMLIQVDEDSIPVACRAWKFMAPYSVGVLVSLALQSNIRAGVISTFDACVGFLESFASLGRQERIGYLRILKAPGVLANSKIQVWFYMRDYAYTEAGFDLGKRSYLLSNAPIFHLRGNSEVVDGRSEIGELVRGVCNVEHC